MANRPKLLYFGLPPWNSQSSGYAKWFFDVYEKLVREGQVEAYCISYSPIILNAFTQRATILSFPYMLAKTIAAADTARKADILHVLNQSPRFSNINPCVSFIRPRSGFKTVLTIHDVLSLDGQVDTSISKVLRHYDCIFTPSEYTKKAIESNFGKNSRILVTYNPVDSDRYHPFDDNQRFRLKRQFLLAHSKPMNSLILLYVGSEMPRKNVQTLLQVTRMLRDRDDRYLLVILSRPSRFRNGLKALVKRLEIEHRVIWIDQMGEVSMPALYNLSDIFITLSRGEGFCVPVVEAMACGKTVIASNMTSLPEIVGKGGYTTALENMELVRDLIIGIVEDGEYGLPSESAIQRAGMFSPETVASRYLKYYHELLS